MTAVTLSSEQVAWATEVAKRQSVECPNFLRMDYRDIPFTKYDKITCLEMAEHVGVKNFSKFLTQVRTGGRGVWERLIMPTLPTPVLFCSCGVC